MLEAVNSTLQTLPLVRASSEKISSADSSFVANPERTQRVPQAPFVSPAVFVDVNFDKAVLQFRNGDTGEVVRTLPSESTLKAQERNAVAADRTAEPVVSAGSSSKEGVASSSKTDVAGGDSAPEPSAPSTSTAPKAEQIAAFEAAARAGNSNAGNVTLTA